MNTTSVTFNLPNNLYDELNQISEASGWSLEKVIVQTIRTGMPPSLNKVPVAFHEPLLALNKMDDRKLLQVVEGELADDFPQDEQHRKADYGTLRRMYALSLLKWRGHPIPTPYESL